MAEPEVRGNCLIGTLKFIREEYQGEQLQGILSAVGNDWLATCERAEDKGFYPARYFSQGLRAVAEAHPEDFELARTQVVGVGRCISSASVAGFMRLLMRMMTPRVLAQKLPDLFSRDFRHTRAYVTVDTKDLADNVLHCHFLEMGELPYVPCAAQGWVYNGLTAMGCSNVKLEGLDADWNCNDGTFKVSWT